MDANLCAILAGAFGGFLLFNYHPARIFMGDCGSLPAGFALAALTLAGPAPHKGVLLGGFLYPALTFAYPIFDTALVSTMRKLAGRPISVGGRDHSSHRLASLGLDQRQVVWILWLLTALGSSLGIMTRLMPDSLFAAGALLIGLLGLFALSLARMPGYPTPVWNPLTSTPLRLHSLDSIVAFMLGSDNTDRNLTGPLEAACSRTTASPR